jgi:hypothetical protein
VRETVCCETCTSNIYQTPCDTCSTKYSNWESAKQVALLEACKVGLESLLSHVGRVQPTVDMLEAAIAKAEGK